MATSGFFTLNPQKDLKAICTNNDIIVSILYLYIHNINVTFIVRFINSILLYTNMRRKSAKPKSTREDWNANGLHYTRFSRRYGMVYQYRVIGTKYL